MAWHAAQGQPPAPTSQRARGTSGTRLPALRQRWKEVLNSDSMFAFGPATARRVKAKLCSRLDRTRRRAGAGEGSSGLREVTDRLLECQSSRQWEEGFGVLQDAIASTVKVDVIAMGIAMSMAQKSPEAAAWASAVAVGKEQ